MLKACPINHETNYLFGPNSISWKTGSDASLIVAAGGAAILQMLHPDVVRVIEKSGRYYQNPKARAERTGLYSRSITYGDPEIVAAAGHSFRRLHDLLGATDPVTGEWYSASEPRLMLWVHNSLTWTILKAFRIYGPSLNAVEEDQYIIEQHKAALLIGLTKDLLPVNRQELDEYMEKMNSQLALTKDSLRFRDFFLSLNGFPYTFTRLVEYLLLQAGVRLMTPLQRKLYGIKTTRLGDACITFFTKLIVRYARYKYPLDSLLPKTLKDLKEHSFGRIY